MITENYFVCGDTFQYPVTDTDTHIEYILLYRSIRIDVQAINYMCKKSIYYTKCEI